ncbi:hydroxyethylthiazole kinase [Carboxydothermus islandicus]|uniref:Hydroxyethylthiazole kinase n=1 Tax=Carboxydothermus islandicus TaxID=661089 RepID=A0A1L8D5K0_9THEO|nr:hydroxyethylthiazole kinase [Carboxydothermus islandicus]GAV26442.1 hydroxyethylthiazole kinase [Carboxydothermus islandicus]
MLNTLWEIREKVWDLSPLVVNLTNNVVTNFTANVLLAAGASPIMSEGIEEADDLVKIANAVVINIGTLHSRQVEYFKKAVYLANKYQKPLLLDPVGLGATTYRNETTFELLDSGNFTIIRGNYGEISFLAGNSAKVKGVDSQASDFTAENLTEVAKRYKTVLVATGPVDYVIAEEGLYLNRTGDIMLQKVTGTGCALTSLIGAFVGVTEEPALAALAALTFYGAASEKARKISTGPGSFLVNFIDSLYNLTEEEFLELTSEKVQVLR